MLTCAGLSRSAAHPSAGPAQSSGPAERTGAQQQLIARLNADILPGCTSSPDDEAGIAIAAVHCDAVRPGLRKRP